MDLELKIKLNSDLPNSFAYIVGVLVEKSMKGMNKEEGGM